MLDSRSGGDSGSGSDSSSSGSKILTWTGKYKLGDRRGQGW